MFEQRAITAQDVHGTTYINFVSIFFYFFILKYIIKLLGAYQ
jgi:hypothetical protein